MNVEAIVLRHFISTGQLPEAWVLRIPSVFFGVLTLLGVFFLARELFRKNGTALFATLLIATSFWHINFSRIAFRAIMAPSFLVWGMYLLLYTFRKIQEDANTRSKVFNNQFPTINKNAEGGYGKERWFENWKSAIKNSAFALFAGSVYDLGMHSYIAYRATPILIVFACWLLVSRYGWKTVLRVFFFAVGAIIAVLPLIIYFAQNPQDFFGRTSGISVFSAPSPLTALGENILKTIGMFFFSGDANWRHNISGAPELFWPVALLFAVGAIWGIVLLGKPKSEVPNPQQTQNHNSQS